MSTQYTTTYGKKKNPWEELGAVLGEGVKKAQTEVSKEKKRKEEEEDDFLAGFRQYENEEKEQLEKFAKIRANADKRAGVADKVLKEAEKQNDDFLAGLNEYADSPKQDNPDLKEFGANSEAYKILQDLGKRWYEADDTRKKELHETAEKVRKLAREGSALKYGQDEIMDLLHRNAKEAVNFKESFEESFPGSLYNLIDDKNILPSSLYLISKTDYGDWDYKYKEDWRVPGEYFDGYYLDEPKSNYRNWLDWIYFDGELMGADKLGNMNMAYVGKKMGLPEWVYKNKYTMDKDDPQWVQYGIHLANSGR